MQCDTKGVNILADNKESKFYNFGESVEFSEKFLIQKDKDIRVNVIGFSKKGVINECEIPISAKQIVKKYSLDNANSLFRIEVYQNDNFCGMVNASYKANP